MDGLINFLVASKMSLRLFWWPPTQFTVCINLQMLCHLCMLFTVSVENKITTTKLSGPFRKFTVHSMTETRSDTNKMDIPFPSYYTLASTKLKMKLKRVILTSGNVPHVIFLFDFWKFQNFIIFYHFMLLDPLYDHDLRSHPWWFWPTALPMTLGLDCEYFSPSGSHRLLCSPTDLVLNCYKHSIYIETYGIADIDGSVLGHHHSLSKPKMRYNSIIAPRDCHLFG